MNVLPLIFLMVIFEISCGFDDDTRYYPTDPIFSIGRKVPIAKPAKRSGRSAPTKHQGPLTIPEVVERHKKLFRIFNAIYIQNLLSQRRIDYFGVISGIWDLENKTVLDKIASLNVDGLLKSLMELDTKIILDSSDETKIVDVEAIEEKMKFLKQITNQTRKSLEDSMKTDSLPKYILNKIPYYARYGLRELENNLAEVALTTLQEIEKKFEASNNTGTQELRFKIDDCKRILKYVPEDLSALIADTGSFEAFLNSIKTPEEVKAAYTLFHNIETRVEKIQQFDDGVNLDTVKKSLNQLKLILENFNQRSSVIPIYVDLESSWIKALLNNGTSLESLQRLFPDFKELAERLKPINTIIGSWFDIRAPDRIEYVSKMIVGIEEVSQVMKKSDIENLVSCLILPPEEMTSLIAEIVQLPSFLPTFLDGVRDVNSILQKVPNITESWGKLEKEYTDLFNVEDKSVEDFEAWRTDARTKEHAELKQFLQSLLPLFSKLKRSDEFIKSLEKVIQGREQVGEIQELLVEFNFVRPNCDALFSFNPRNLEDLNKFPKQFSTFKSRYDIYELKPLLESLPKVISELKKLKKSGPSGMFRSGILIRNPGNIIGFESATKSLEAMVKIHQHSKMIEVIKNRGEEAKKKVESDPELKAKFGSVWQGFDELKTSLTTLQTEINTALSKVPLTGDEKNLEDVGKVYSALINASITISPILLGDYRRSLMEFPDSGSWKDLEHALAILEKPVATNFATVYATFKKIPKALKELQRDLWDFFGETKQSMANVRLEVEDESKRYKRHVSYVMLAMIVIGAIAFVGWKLKEKRDESIMAAIHNGQDVFSNRIRENMSNPPAAKVQKRENGEDASHNRAPAPELQRRAPSNTDRDVMPIAMITQNVYGFKINGTITRKEAIRTFPPKNTKVFNFEVTDSNGDTIRCVAFNELAESLYSTITENVSYFITNGKVVPANKRFNNTGHDYEINLSNVSIVEPGGDVVAAPKLNLKRISLGEIAGHSGERIDVLAYVEKMDPKPTEFTSKAGKTVVKRDMELIDESNRFVKLTLWGEEAIKADYLHKVVAFKGVIPKKDFNGAYSLGTGYGARIIADPEISGVTELYEWYKTVKPTKPSGSSSEAPRTIAGLQKMQFGDSEKGDFASVKAMITRINPNTALYKGCSSEGCQKKVIELDGEFRCEKCNKTMRHFKWLYMMQFELSDETGQVYVTAFGDNATKVVGRTAAEVGELKETKPGEYNAVFEKLKFVSKMWRLRCKMETYNEEVRQKMTVFGVEEVNQDKYIGDLKQFIEQMESIE
ncbi:hypothetical protein CAEBREN_17155 [Caenorhabditis brenneri]|uniref:Replication protein A subunit n=1 Tax=Caenorhabditis brenneri TaxID=135651 RepID=G0NIN0_CAEBE|nr:hypothetical protein CAEBREN_17155 [Caenorhabditis brenneri]